MLEVCEVELGKGATYVAQLHQSITNHYKHSWTLMNVYKTFMIQEQQHSVIVSVGNILVHQAMKDP